MSSGKEALSQLHDMFPTYDLEVIKAVLESQYGQVERATEDLLKLDPQQAVPQQKGLKPRTVDTKPYALAMPKDHKAVTEADAYGVKAFSGSEFHKNSERSATVVQAKSDAEIAAKLYKIELQKDKIMKEKAQSWFGIAKSKPLPELRINSYIIGLIWELVESGNQAKKKSGLLKKMSNGLKGVTKKGNKSISSPNGSVPNSGVKYEVSQFSPMKGQAVVEEEIKIVSGKEDKSLEIWREAEERKMVQSVKVKAKAQAQVSQVPQDQLYEPLLENGYDVDNQSVGHQSEVSDGGIFRLKEEEKEDDVIDIKKLKMQYLEEERRSKNQSRVSDSALFALNDKTPSRSAMKLEDMRFPSQSKMMNDRTLRLKEEQEDDVIDNEELKMQYQEEERRSKNQSRVSDSALFALNDKTPSRSAMKLEDMRFPSQSKMMNDRTPSQSVMKFEDMKFPSQSVMKFEDMKFPSQSNMNLVALKEEDKAESQSEIPLEDLKFLTYEREDSVVRLEDVYREEPSERSTLFV